ncbi:MAG TPA: glycoside hydrolase family 2 TIM barrel-domain containing protein [Thermomicrobiales bacterium]|nr:glycoside hydrolase family 2 TIM barrel-domain containing protein [Thermomicrobiales bacterium]
MYNLADTHPTPQFARPRWHDLTGEWQFAFDPEDVGRDAHWESHSAAFDRIIIVPFPPESTASGIGDPNPHRVVWYRRVVDLDVLPREHGERLLLRFGAVDYRADVWVNGAHVAFNEGGHTPFHADITQPLANQDVADIVVRAEDNPHDLGQPRGKQDWQTPSHGIWYRRTTGIWQPVWLEATGRHRISDLHWQPDADSLTVDAATSITPASSLPLTLHVELALNGDTLADDRYTFSGDRHTARWQLGAPGNPETRRTLIWSQEHPNLIEAKLSLLDGEQVLDRIYSYTGLRSVAVDANGLVLNRFPVYLRMVLEQGFWPESHLAAPSAEAIRREVELIRDLGFNAARIHQKIEDPRFLSWCDRLGVLVWGEMANAFTWNETAVTRMTREWTDAVLRDRNHPSVVAWVPINESWGVPALPVDARQRHWQEAHWHLTHALDGTRPVISNDGWEHTTSDILTIHDYTESGDEIREKYGADGIGTMLERNRPNRRVLQLEPGANVGRPVMITEYGGISYAPDAGERWYGYGTVTSEADYIDKVRELTEAVRACPDVTGFCYTQLTDTEQETNGLLTADREPKLPVESLREIFGQ